MVTQTNIQMEIDLLQESIEHAQLANYKMITMWEAFKQPPHQGFQPSFSKDSDDSSSKEEYSSSRRDKKPPFPLLVVVSVVFERPKNRLCLKGSQFGFHFL